MTNTDVTIEGMRVSEALQRMVLAKLKNVVAENERLKSEMGELTDLYTTYRGLVVDGQDITTLIERLRTENDERARETERVLAKLKDVAIENERLREDLNGHKKLIVDLDAEVNPLKKENERLRYEKGLMVAALEQIRGAHLPEAPKESYQRAVAAADNALRLVLGGKP